MSAPDVRPSPSAEPVRRLLERLERGERWALLVGGVGAGLGVAQALLSPALALTAAVLAAVTALLWLLRAPVWPGWVDGALVSVGGLLGVAVGSAQQNAAAGLALFLITAHTLKLAAPRRPRDRGVAAVIALVLVAAGCSEAVEPGFALMFLVAIGGLGLSCACRALRLQLVGVRADPGARDADGGGEADATQVELVLSEPARAPGHAGPSPRRATPLLGIGRRSLSLALPLLLLGTGAFFAGFPRLGVKLMSQQRAGTQRTAGFTDIVGLEDIGRLRNNTRVAFRAETERAFADDGELYWRGRALDAYDGKSWSATRALERASRGLDLEELSTFEDRFTPEPGPEARELTVYLEPIGARCLFTPGPVRRVTFEGARPPSLHRDPMGSLLLHLPTASAIVYRVLAEPDAVLRVPLDPGTERRVRRLCLALPRAVDVERLREFARRALAARRVPSQASATRQADAITRYLAGTFRYSLEADPPPEGREPVEDFLFRRRRGHCELFASAVVLLLRSLDIPARLVTGFRGGEYNEWSGAYTVRQSNAHAWVEAYVDGAWRRYDSTPADPSGASASGTWQVLDDLGEWLELRWFSWVVTYDAYDQRNTLRALAARLNGLGMPGTGGAIPGAGALSAALLLGLALVAGALAFARRRARARPDAAVPPELARLLEALSVAGCPRAPHETLLEVARRAEIELSPPDAPSAVAGLSAWAEARNATRFGGHAPGAAHGVELRRLLDALERR